MLIENLKNIGLSNNEAKIYFTLSKLKTAKAGTIIKKTSLHRNIVYENLEKLINKGLISYIYENKVKTFKIEKPYNLINMIDKNLEEIKKRKKIAQKINKELENLTNEISHEKVSVFKGIKGVRSVMENLIEFKTNIFVLGAPYKSVEIMPPKFWEHYNNKIKNTQIKFKMIFNEDTKNWSKNLKNKNGEIKFLPKQFESLTQFTITNNTVFIFIWSKNPLVIKIENPELYKSYLKHFNFLWEIAN